MFGKLIILLLALLPHSILGTGTCPIYINGNSYDLNFGNIKGIEGNSFSYYFNFCENVPYNIQPGVTCPNVGNAYQVQLTTNPVTCTLIGNMGTGSFAELPNGAGLQINMTNEVCCKCVNNAVFRTVVMNIMCGPTPSINNFPITEPANPKCQYIGTITHPNACPPSHTTSASTTGPITTTTGTSGAGPLPAPSVIFAVTYSDESCQVFNGSGGFMTNMCLKGESFSMYLSVTGSTAKLCTFKGPSCSSLLECVVVQEDICYPGFNGTSITYVWPGASSLSSPLVSTDPLELLPLLPTYVSTRVKQHLGLKN